MKIGLSALLLLAAGCAAPTQYRGEIPVDQAGFAERMQTLCHVTDASECLPSETPPEG